MGLIEVLTIIFTIAKITGHLDWSWFQVFQLQMYAIVFYMLIFIGMLAYAIKNG